MAQTAYSVLHSREGPGPRAGAGVSVVLGAMKLGFVLLAAVGCLTPPPRLPASSVPLPEHTRPSEWSLWRVDYDVGAGGVVAASNDARIALLRRCGGDGHSTSVNEISGRDLTIGPHLDRALGLWSTMPLNPAHTGCDLLRLEYRRFSGGRPPIAVTDRATFLRPTELQPSCISCPSSGPSVPVAAGKSLLVGCVSESGKVTHGKVLRSGGGDADLIALGLFGASAFQPYLVGGKPLPVCATFAYDVRAPGY